MMFRTTILRFSFFGYASLAILLALASTVEAKRKKGKNKGAKAACAMSYLPFVKGTQWKYEYAIPPGVEDRPGGLKAKIPETFSILVKEVEVQSDKTVITLSESYRNIVRETTLSCNKDFLTVPPDSFFFAGELPGALGISLQDLSLKGDTYPASKGLVKGSSLFVEVKARLVRTPGGDAKATHHDASLELERQITIGKDEEIDVKHGVYRAQAVEVALSGRITLAPTPDKPVPLSDGKAMLWFKSGTGLVRAYNRLDQGWELMEMKNAAGEDI